MRKFLDPYYPINWSNAVNQLLIAHWLTIQFSGFGTNTWYDLCKKYSGTLSNGPVWNSAISRFNGYGSLLFDGTDDFVQTTLNGNSIGINSGVTDGRTGFTIDFWFKRNSTDTNDILWSWNNNNGVGLLLETGGFTYQNDMQDANNILVSYSYTHDQNWHHCVLVDIARTITPKLYIDGNELAVIADSGGAINPTASNLIIGGRISGTACWRGWIDNFRVTNRVLNNVEIAYLYSELSRPFSNILNFKSTRSYFFQEQAAPVVSNIGRLIFIKDKVYGVKR